MKFVKNWLPLVSFSASAIILIALFYMGFSFDAMAYSILTFWIVLPLICLAMSIYYGLRDQMIRFLLIPFSMLIFMLTDFFTFRLENALHFSKTPHLNFSSSIYGLLACTIGLIFGYIIAEVDKYIKKKKAL